MNFPRRILWSLLIFITSEQLNGDMMVAWNQDSDAGFFVQLTGCLDAGPMTSMGVLPNEVLNSPSGLWSIHYWGGEVAFDGGRSTNPYLLSANATTGDFSGDSLFHFQTGGGYGSGFSDLPKSSANLFMIFSTPDGSPPDLWEGRTELAFTSADDIKDFATWHYDVKIYLNNPNHAVSDSGSILPFFAISIFCILMRRKIRVASTSTDGK